MRIRYSRKDEIAYKAREAAEEATNKSELSLIRNLMKNMNLTAEAAMKALEIPSEKFATYAAML
ncbi:MAG: hypothetical protein SO022_11315 [Selenomonadaceae bacterium]|nr:hypothetical protein [Selenomonadaceae bacterium]